MTRERRKQLDLAMAIIRTVAAVASAVISAFILYKVVLHK